MELEQKITPTMPRIHMKKYVVCCRDNDCHTSNDGERDDGDSILHYVDRSGIVHPDSKPALRSDRMYPIDYIGAFQNLFCPKPWSIEAQALVESHLFYKYAIVHFKKDIYKHMREKDKFFKIIAYRFLDSSSRLHGHVQIYMQYCDKNGKQMCKIKMGDECNEKTLKKMRHVIMMDRFLDTLHPIGPFTPIQDASGVILTNTGLSLESVDVRETKAKIKRDQLDVISNLPCMRERTP